MPLFTGNPHADDGANEQERIDAEIDDQFTYFPPRNAMEAEEHERVRSMGRALAHTISRMCGEGPEARKAVAKAREAVMWANAALAMRRRDDVRPMPPAHPGSYDPNGFDERITAIENDLAAATKYLADIYHQIMPKATNQTGTIDKQWAEVETVKPRRPEKSDR